MFNLPHPVGYLPAGFHHTTPPAPLPAVGALQRLHLYGSTTLRALPTPRHFTHARLPLPTVCTGWINVPAVHFLIFNSALNGSRPATVWRLRRFRLPPATPLLLYAFTLRFRFPYTQLDTPPTPLASGSALHFASRGTRLAGAHAFSLPSALPHCGAYVGLVAHARVARRCAFCALRAPRVCATFYRCACVYGLRVLLTPEHFYRRCALHCPLLCVPVTLFRAAFHVSHDAFDAGLLPLPYHFGTTRVHCAAFARFNTPFLRTHSYYRHTRDTT